MTSKEYLRQAYRLDQKINSDIEEVARLREIAGSISSPLMGDKVPPRRKFIEENAKFVKNLDI